MNRKHKFLYPENRNPLRLFKSLLMEEVNFLIKIFGIKSSYNAMCIHVAV